jgi:hypothetical protein
MSLRDLFWLAGLLEWEGSFSIHNSPRIALRMNDRDVVERAAEVMRATANVLTIERANTNATRPSYEINVGGSRAIGVMLTLYPLLGARRQSKIREVVAEWRTRPMRPRPPQRLLCGHPDRKHAARRMCKNYYTMWRQGRLREDLHPEVYAAGYASDTSSTAPRTRLR